MKRIEIKKLDAVWSKKIKERDKVCQVPGCRETYLNSAHVIGRLNYPIRWDLRNGIALCVAHHRDYDEHRPYMLEVVEEKIGNTNMWELEDKAKIVGVKRFYEEVLEELNN